MTFVLLWPLLAALAAKAPGQEDGANPPPDLRYKVLVVVAPKCKDPALPRLKNVSASGQKIAQAFRKLRYEVTLLAEGVPKADGKPTAAEVRGWLDKIAVPESTKLAFLILAGHGVQRANGTDKEPWFLTSDATQTKGGVSLEEIDRQGRKQKWPLAIVVDACRVDVVLPKPKQGTTTDGQAALYRGPLTVAAIAGRSQHRTRISSARPGDVAPDWNDLVTELAAGLEIDPDTKRFRADPWFQVAGGQKPAKGNSLSILSWFHYGLTKYTYRHGLRHCPQVIPGSPDLDVVFVQANPPGPPLGPPVFPPPQVSNVNLLRNWRPQHGNFVARPAHDGHAWKITVPPEGAGRYPWIAGYVAEQGEGFETTGKALFVELLATFSPLDPFPPATMAIGLDAKYIDATNRNFWVAKEGKVRRVVTPSRTTWCKISLEPKKKLNYFAVTDLPSGCVVTVRQLYLADDKHQVPTEAGGSIDVMARWWTGDAGQIDPQALRFGIEVVNGSRALRVGAGTGWMGGILGPRLWVSPGNEVELEIENTGRRAAQVLVEIKQKYAVLGARVLQLPPGRSTQRFPIKSPGLADYFAVTKPTADLRFHAIRLERGSPNVAQPK